MAKLIYSAIASLDGYTVDADGRFDWAAPDEEVHAFVNDTERSVGTYLYGRRMYETMRVWQNMPAGQSATTQDYAQIWRAAEKIVYSTTLAEVDTPRTRLARAFDPAEVAALMERSKEDVSVGGSGLAAHALWSGLVDELRLFLVPAIVGGGTRALPDRLRADLDLVEQRRFGGGTVYLRYDVRPGASST